MHGVDIAVAIPVKGAIHQPVCQPVVLQKQMGSDVFCLTVEARRNGESFFADELQRCAAQRKRKQEVYMIDAVQRPFQHRAFRPRNDDAVLAHITVERSCGKRRHDIIIRLVFAIGVRADNTNGVSLGAQRTDQVHRRNGHAVILFAEHVTDNANGQNNLFPDGPFFTGQSMLFDRCAKKGFLRMKNLFCFDIQKRFFIWRRERDSNPRYGSPYTRFPVVRLRPSSAISARHFVDLCYLTTIR